MKKNLSMIYTKDKLKVFNNLNIERIKQPLNISREEFEKSEEVEFTKAKSKVVEYEDEEYSKLKEDESKPDIITDSNGKQLRGRLQTFVNDYSMYFVFVEKGDTIEVSPVEKWYNFSLKPVVNENEEALEKMDKKIKKVKEIQNESSAGEEFDFNDKFDDDDEELDKVFGKWDEERELNETGEKLNNMVNEIEEGVKRLQDEEEATKKINTDEEGKKVRKTLQDSDLIRIFSKGKITIKELIKIIKQDFMIGDEEKAKIGTFLKTKC